MPKTKRKPKAITVAEAQHANRMDEASQIVFKKSVMLHGVALLPKLREMGWKERMAVMQAAQELTLEDAVWLDIDESPDKRLKYQVPGWSDKPISGAQVLALMVFGLWVSIGENEEVAAGLLVDWPDIPAYIKLYSDETWVSND